MSLWYTILTKSRDEGIAAAKLRRPGYPMHLRRPATQRRWLPADKTMTRSVTRALTHRGAC